MQCAQRGILPQVSHIQKTFESWVEQTDDVLGDESDDSPMTPSSPAPKAVAVLTPTSDEY